jgi:hypothetical protein
VGNIAAKKRLKLGKITIRELDGEQASLVGGGGVSPTVVLPEDPRWPIDPPTRPPIAPITLLRTCYTAVCPRPTLRECPAPTPTKTAICPIQLD